MVLSYYAEVLSVIYFYRKKLGIITEYLSVFSLYYIQLKSQNNRLLRKSKGMD